MPRGSIDLGDPEVRRRFKAAYDKAAADGADQFTFDGMEVLVGYAYHLLVYAADRLAMPELKPKSNPTRP